MYMAGIYAFISTELYMSLLHVTPLRHFKELSMHMKEEKMTDKRGGGGEDWARQRT